MSIALPAFETRLEFTITQAPPSTGLPLNVLPSIFFTRRTLAEIEAAIAALSPAEMKQLEGFVRERRAQAEEARLQELYRINGVHPLPRRNNVVITNEMINQLREEENI